jgi:hypothetical protein
MDTKVIIKVDLDEEGVVFATYIGTNISRFWSDPHLRSFIDDAIKVAGKGKDIFDFTNFLFSQIDNSIRRRYGGRELQLDSVKFIKNDGSISILSLGQ